jgi:hypothetical protein
MSENFGNVSSRHRINQLIRLKRAAGYGDRLNSDERRKWLLWYKGQAAAYDPIPDVKLDAALSRYRPFVLLATAGPGRLTLGFLCRQL